MANLKFVKNLCCQFFLRALNCLYITKAKLKILKNLTKSRQNLAKNAKFLQIFLKKFKITHAIFNKLQLKNLNNKIKNLKRKIKC